jgi:hypothetical protein
MTAMMRIYHCMPLELGPTLCISHTNFLFLALPLGSEHCHLSSFARDLNTIPLLFALLRVPVCFMGNSCLCL